MGRIQLLQEDSASAILSTIWEPVRFPHIWRTFISLASYVSHTKIFPQQDGEN